MRTETLPANAKFQMKGKVIRQPLLVIEN